MPEVTVGRPVIDKASSPQATTWPLQLTNKGPVLDIFGFSTQGIPPTWVSFDKLQVHLMPGASEEAHLTVRPTPESRAGSYLFTLRVISFNNVSDRVELSLSVDVPPVGLVTLSVSPSKTELQDSSTAGVTVQLAAPATNNLDLLLGLEASDEEGLGEYTFEPRQLRLLPGETKMSALRIRSRTPLAAEDPPRTFKVNVTATTGAGESTQPATVSVTQKAGKPPTLDLRPKVGAAERSFTYTLTVVNPNNADVIFALSGSDPENGCDFAFQPPSLPVPRHGAGEAVVTVTARRDLEGPSEKAYPFTIAATRNGDLLPAAKSEEGRFVQTPTRSVTLSLVQPLHEVRGGNSATYSARVSNPRSIPVQVALDVKDDEGALRVSIAPSVVRLAPGADGQAMVRVSAKIRVSPGDRKAHKFLVLGILQDGTAIPPAPATLVQIGPPDVLRLIRRVGGWVVWALVMLFVVSMAAALIAAIVEGDLWSQKGNFLDLYTHPAVQFLLHLPFAGPVRALLNWVFQVLRVLPSNLRAN
ncbi:MAG: hypothetical protein U0641_18080 [Anaerolineae bacterium]